MTAVETKDALNGRAEEFAHWLFPAGHLKGGEWQIGSVGGEAGKSLCIRVRGSKVGVFKDFATGDSGNNLVELLAQAKRIEFKHALRECADWLGAPLDRHNSTSPPTPICQSVSNGLPSPMSASDCERALAMAATLRSDSSLCERIARARNWRVETIVELTYEPSLGWASGKLAFLYESGVKLRSRQDGERIIHWAFGKPWLWRGGFLWGRSTIYICEGETDCISLIDAGLEKDGHTLAVGIPSATTFAAEWAQLFRGKDVILAFDSDPAGEQATRRISSLLKPVVRELKRLNWGGLQHAS